MLDWVKKKITTNLYRLITYVKVETFLEFHEVSFKSTVLETKILQTPGKQSFVTK